MTALHRAVEHQYLHIIEELLIGGACLLPDKFGITPLMQAAAAGEKEICEYIYSKK